MICRIAEKDKQQVRACEELRERAKLIGGRWV
jgi:hypothetical protein